DTADRPIVGGFADANGPVVNPSDRNLAVARLDTSGALDTTFDGDGITVATSPGPATDDTLRALTLDSAGRIVAVGLTGIYPPRDTLVARWLPTGALDTTFDGDGLAILDLDESNGDDSGIDVAVDATDRVIVLGVAAGQPALARLSPSGALDPSFGGDGIVQQSFTGAQSFTERVLIQDDGKILVTGGIAASTGTRFDFAALRLTSAGALDTSWSSPDGVRLINFDTTNAGVGSLDRAYTAALRPDGRLLLAGSANNDAAIARLLGDGHANGPATTLVIESDTPDPSLTAELVTVSYSVTSAGGIPSGEVRIRDGVGGCTGTLSSGAVATGSCELRMFTVGERTLVAEYLGDGQFCPSSDTEAHLVKAGSQTIFLSLTPQPSVVGQPVTAVVRVNSLVGGVSGPTGTVTIEDGAGASCAGPLVASEASCVLVPTVGGNRSWTASYSGDGTFGASSGNAFHTVARASSTTEITSITPGPSIAPEPVRVDVTVTASSTGAGVPGGPVLVDDGVGVNCLATLSAGSGSCELIPAVLGELTFTATYLGDASFESSQDTETHQVLGVDFGDAPASFPVLAADGGASHSLGSGLFLGSTVDSEPDGQPSPQALGDDDLGDDEDGVTFAGPAAPGESVEVTVQASMAGLLDAWVDFDGDGTWNEATERVFTAEPLTPGFQVLTLSLPAATVLGDLAARFRLSSAGVAAAGGAAADGEVEDHILVSADSQPPRVSAVSTLDGTPVEDCVTIREPIEGLRITFDEPVVAADQTSSYRVVAAGPDALFSTVDCTAGVAGDDQDLSLASATSDGDPSTPTITLLLAEAAPRSLLGLLVCSAVEDGAGNGVAPELLTFRSDPGNLFRNGDFDRCPTTLVPWDAAAAPPNSIVPEEGVDAEGSPLSGSARLLSASPEPLALGQCVDPGSGDDLAIELRARLDPVVSATATLGVRCELFDQASCAGASSGEQVTSVPLAGPTGSWVRLGFPIELPAPALSARCTVSVSADDPQDAQFDAYLDRLFFGATGLLFVDGFESGNTSRWSQP
ncbi:MAG: Ig-like domain repeat protein, partial [Holophagales bacterium]|nr:Ig-like domain repeat protein [Holophagales bacterium]